MKCLSPPTRYIFWMDCPEVIHPCSISDVTLDDLSLHKRVESMDEWTDESLGIAVSRQRDSQSLLPANMSIVLLLPPPIKSRENHAEGNAS